MWNNFNFIAKLYIFEMYTKKLNIIDIFMILRRFRWYNYSISLKKYLCWITSDLLKLKVVSSYLFRLSHSLPLITKIGFWGLELGRYVDNFFLFKKGLQLYQRQQKRTENEIKCGTSFIKVIVCSNRETSKTNTFVFRDRCFSFLVYLTLY